MSNRIRSRHIHKRTRAGCQTCKKRRKRCDEARPICGSCAKLNLKCTYDMHLRWATTRDPFVEQNKPSDLHWDTAYDFSSASPEPSSDGALRLQLQRIGATQGLQRIIFSVLSSRDQEILLKFLTSGYRTLASDFRVDNEFFNFFNECERSFASLWSCITYQVSLDRDYDHLFDEYYHKCLVLFRKEISELRSAENDEPLWFVGMFLCGISINRLLPWTIHVNAMITILKSQYDLGNVDPNDEEMQETLTMLGCFEIPAYILNRKTRYHRLWVQHCLGQSGVEEGCGIPCSLLDLMAQLDVPGTTDALFMWQPPLGEMAQIYSWDATRYASILRALEDSKQDGQLDIATSLLQRGVSLGEVVQSLLSSVQQCLPYVLPELSHFKQTLIFPLVMAASQRNVLSEDAKEFICSTLQNLSMEVNYYHHQGILRIIKEHWANDADTIEETTRRLDIELAMW
ncbi:hypothetical protein BS50DRAFT_680621 [Corynespora cassiicola Philippines]|uniref:Zn(2)-C6 fungal-type domain-containing protein n=1 Tax=Corynespora cassiicola Philippines TaxID=1448308 RepID=A0A2T2N9E2_CORCC|nr:hypothetical protein BS50DRAFT_680621 [Corynespora cassiicola Philippines]